MKISRQTLAIILSLFIGAVLTLIGIYGFGEYGYSLFLLTPLFLGLCPAVIVGKDPEFGRREAIFLGIKTLLIGLFLLLLFALEGAVCIIMALPLAIPLNIVGSIMGFYIIQAGNNQNLSIWILIVTIPGVSFVEKETYTEELLMVTTEIEIDADIETVWKNVVEFPELDAPEEFIFNYGISYPISAHIEGKGVGAIRYCNFSTGSFKEPITTWNEPYLLQFNVDQSPAPMEELSIWEVDAPHLHNYFNSKKGEFRLVKMGKNKTKLIGTTWYVNKIRPVFYWRLWSDHIIHKIHERVLKHIKMNAEK